MCKKLIALFLLLTTPFILSAGNIDLSTDSHPMSGNSIEEEFDDFDIIEIIIGLVAIVGAALLFGEDIFKDGGLLGPAKYWPHHLMFWDSFL